MYTKTSWSLAEFEAYYNIAMEHHAHLMIIVWSMDTFQQYPHYIVQLSGLEAALAEIEGDKSLEIVAVVEIKATFKETLTNSEVHCCDEVIVEPFLHKWLHCCYCKHCGRKAFVEPFYDYVVGRPLLECPYCGSQVANSKRQEWELMSDWEKIRAMTAGVVITAVHGFMGGLLAGMMAIGMESVFSYDSNDLISVAMLSGAAVSIAATLYSRFGVIFNSLKRTKDKDYVELLYTFGVAKSRSVVKKRVEGRFSWEELNQSRMAVDYHRSDGEIEHAYIKLLLNSDSGANQQNIEKYVFHIGIIYSELGQKDRGIWIKKSLPGQGALLRALATEYKPQIFLDFPLDKTQMPLGVHNKMILLAMNKKEMLESLEKYCVVHDEKTETDMLAGSSFDGMFDLVQIMYHMEESNGGNYYFALGIGCIEK